MSVATGSNEAAGGASGGGARVFFQSPRGGAGGSPGSSSGSGSSREDSAPVATAAADGQVQPPPPQQQQRRHQQGKVTVKYDRKELRKRLVLEEWIVEQLGQLYGCEVPGRGAGGSGASSAALSSRRNSPGHQLPGARLPDSWGPSAGSEMRRFLSPGCPLAPGRRDWDASAWVQRLGARRAAGPLGGPEEGWVFPSALLFSEPRALLGSSCCYTQRSPEGLTQLTPNPRRTALCWGPGSPDFCGEGAREGT